MATRFRLNFEQIFGTSAQVLAGGTLTFAISGGAPDQLKTVYQDPALTVTKINPVVLDSAGKHGDIWLDDPGTYRLIVKDAAGIVLPGGDLDPLDGGASASKNTNAGLINVRAFGAKGDGTTDDWAALDACWNYAISNSQASIFVPVGTYMLSRSLNINNASLWGASEVGCVFKAMPSFTGDAVLYLDATRAGGGGTDAHYTTFRIHGNRGSVSTTVAGLKLLGNVLYNTFSNIRIEETTGAGVLLDATAGPERPTLCTFTNVHVSSTNSHGWYFKGGRHITMTDCASESIGGKGVYFSGETETLSKIENARMYLENIAGDGIFIGDGDEFRTISPLVNGYGNDAVACYGYRVDGSVATFQTFLYGGQFTKNPTLFLRDRTRSTDGHANINSKDFRFAAGTSHVIENGYVPPGQIDDPLNAYPLQIRGNRFTTPVSAYPMTWTNGVATLATNTTTFLGAFSGAQDAVESNVRQYLTGYVTLSGMRAESTVMPGGAFQYQVQIFVDTNPTPFLLVLTNANSAVGLDVANELLVAPNSYITCRVLVDNGAAPIPQRGLHVTIGMRA